MTSFVYEYMYAFSFLLQITYELKLQFGMPKVKLFSSNIKRLALALCRLMVGEDKPQGKIMDTTRKILLSTVWHF